MKTKVSGEAELCLSTRARQEPPQRHLPGTTGLLVPSPPSSRGGEGGDGQAKPTAAKPKPAPGYCSDSDLIQGR